MAQPSTGDVKVDDKLKEWFAWDKNEKNVQEIKDLVQEGNISELQKRLLHRMEFGTAGLRTRMGAGFSMMNDLTIIQTSQGLAKYLMKANPSAKESGVVVGYDGRHNSQRFAALTAAAFNSLDIPVYLFSKVCPTPYVAYGVIHHRAACGIMVTASHNPKEDNGYKVYWSNGSQIISPIDKGISESILDNLEPWPSAWDVSSPKSNKLRKDPYDEIYTHYNRDVIKLCRYKELNTKCPITFTYTAMHGVGYIFAVEALKLFGFPEPIPVKEQIWPDPDFPTVKYPNPEEGKGALTLSIQAAEAGNSVIIIANDPDADRLALAEKQPNGEWKIFTGNEIGAFLGWWSWYSFNQAHPEVKGEDVYMLASTVSSKILRTIAQAEGFHFEETLTGFKWMGNKTDELMKQGKTVLFAFEEAIGYMCGTSVLDKDGVSAAAVAAELCSYLYQQNLTLNQQLDKIYAKYGYHLSSNSYFLCHDPKTIEQMFAEIRNYQGTGKYPESCGPYKIRDVRDLTVGYDSSQPNNKPVLPVSKSSQMMTFTFENGCVATIRTSGTEPKIKYYTEHCPDPKQGLDRVGAERELQDMVECIKKYFYQPDKFRNILPRQS
ncbi:hypothetical protein ScPMuIL_010181 [Solemya velum]